MSIEPLSPTGESTPPAVCPRFLAIFGPSGSGKTTTARLIARRMGVPVLELDSVFHQPGWEPLPEPDFRERVARFIEANPGGWVIDGNYRGVRDIVLDAADTAVWIRLPFRTVYPRLVTRTMRRAWQRAPLWNGNRESFRMAFLSRESILLWGVTNWRPHVRKMTPDLAAARTTTNVVVLRSPQAVRAWIRGVHRP